MFRKIFFLALFCKILTTNSQVFDWIDTLKYSNKTIPSDITFNTNGEIYLSGTFFGYRPDGYNGTFINKYSTSGNLMWIDSTNATHYPLCGSGTDTDNNVYTVVWVGGQTSTIKIGNTVYPLGAYLVKYNSAGQMQWVVNTGFLPSYMTIDHAGFIYITGPGGWNGVTAKFNSSGVCVGTIPYGAPLAVDLSNNLYILFNGVRKYSPTGNLLWTYQCGNTNSNITVDNLGNCYVFQGGMYMTSYLLKLDQMGQFLWTITLPFDGGHAIYPDSNNDIYLAGSFGVNQISDGTEIRKYDGNGNNLWSRQIPNSSLLCGPQGIVAKNGEIYVCAADPFSYWSYLFKITEPKIPTSLKKNQSENNISVSPNPSNSAFTLLYKSEDVGLLSLKVRDAFGKVVYTKNINNSGGELNETIDLTGFAKGVYFLNLTNAKVKETRKLVVE